MKDIIQKIYDYSLEEIMGERFARYSKYIIQDRAIPDVRDGLKPVQRRILFGMYKEKYTYDKPTKKSARAVGDIMGKYHPHGDTSIYDAMIRMSQYWKMGKTLIDVQGNNGSIDGDSAAAMRYTEARLSKISNEMLKDIDKNTVMMVPNYDDLLTEPTVLPAKFPNLLVNGAMGISAGYATNIPPHNLGEVINATIHRIDYPNSRLETLLDIIKGPDFPTGAIVEGRKGLESAYKTGRGKIIIKAKTRFDKVKGKDQLVITAIPYDVIKADLVKKIEEIRIEKKIDGIAEVRDESSKDGLRIAVDLKKEADQTLILNYLLKNTDLQISYNFNVIAIVDRRPKLLGLIDILDAYIAHQKEVLTRSSEFDLMHAKERLHIQEGLIKAVSILDDVIKTIRASKNKEDAQNNLCKEYDFTEKQAIAIVTLQLYRLTNTDIIVLQNDINNLNKIIAILTAILSDENVLMNEIKKELRRIRDEYDTPRLTEIKDEISEIKIDTTMIIPKEDVVVVITKEGYVKRVSTRSYASSNGDDTLLKENDYIIGMYEMNTLDVVLLFTDLGNYLYVPVYDIPDTKWKELGKHISNIITIKGEESIVGCVPVYDFDKDVNITTFTKNGMVKSTKLSEYKIQRYSKPVTNIKLKDKDVVINVYCNRFDNVIVVTNTGYGLRYNVSEIPVTGVKSGGVKAISLKNDYLASGIILDSSADNITLITDKGSGKRIKLSDIETSSRARRGLLLLKEVKSNPQRVIKILSTESRKQIGIKTKNDIKIIKNSELPIMDRYSIGSSILKGNVIDAFVVSELTNNATEEAILKKEEKNVSLEDIDNRIMTIDDFLKDIDSM